MFKEIEDRLDITNDLLRKIEKHLRDLTLPPDIIDWANKFEHYTNIVIVHLQKQKRMVWQQP